MGYAWRKNSLLSQGFYGGEVKGGGAGLSLVPATGQFKAVPGQFKLCMKKHCFTNRVVNHWNRFQERRPMLSSLSVFKKCLDNPLNNML